MSWRDFRLPLILGVCLLIAYLWNAGSDDSKKDGKHPPSQPKVVKHESVDPKQRSKQIAQDYIKAVLTYGDIRPYATPQLYKELSSRQTPPKKPTVSKCEATEGKRYGDQYIWTVTVSVDNHFGLGLEEHVYRVYVDMQEQKVVKDETLF